MTRRPLVAAVFASLAVTFAIAIAIWRPGAPDPAGAAVPSGTAEPATPLPVPVPGHEVYGYVPYWEMDEGIAAHLAETDLTTLGLFSVTHRRSGALAKDERGYQLITADIGGQMIREAHDRGVRVELVYTSFGESKNAAFFADGAAQDRTISELVALADGLGVDGINVDVELLDLEDVPAYGAFVGRLRAAIRTGADARSVSVATGAGVRGTAMAAAASAAGADRIFLMGYDYHTAGSEPGASAPLARRDGSEKDLTWSLDLYRAAGVPAERTILGLPLYGIVWPTEGPEVGAGATGRGEVWVPRRNLAVLDDPTHTPVLDPIESVEVLALPVGTGWQSVYYDSAASLTPKLGLANAHGLAGAGFWAIGYERGLPEYTELIASFRAGRPMAAESTMAPSPIAP
jgi:spore germination protein YaaH